MDQFHLLAFTVAFLELLADRTQVLGENARRAAGFPANDHRNLAAGQLGVGVCLLDLRVVPFRNLAQEDPHVGVARQLQVGHIVEMVRQDDTPGRHRQELHTATDLLHLFGLHGHVAGAEVSRYCR